MMLLLFMLLAAPGAVMAWSAGHGAVNRAVLQILSPELVAIRRTLYCKRSSTELG